MHGEAAEKASAVSIELFDRHGDPYADQKVRVQIPDIDKTTTVTTEGNGKAVIKVRRGMRIVVTPVSREARFSPPQKILIPSHKIEKVGFTAVEPIKKNAGLVPKSNVLGEEPSKFPYLPVFLVGGGVLAAIAAVLLSEKKKARGAGLSDLDDEDYDDDDDDDLVDEDDEDFDDDDEVEFVDADRENVATPLRVRTRDLIDRGVDPLTAVEMAARELKLKRIAGL